MAMKGETIHLGAPTTCVICNKTPTLEVYRSNAGYYIGTYCNCGPYTRESHYYPSLETAQSDLDNGTVNFRTSEYNGQ